MAVGGGVNDFSVSDVHCCVCDFVRTGTEEQKIAFAQILSLDCFHSLPGRLPASRGILMPRLRTSICVNPEQSYP